ncbi:MAG: DUF523 domain-containing protein [Bacilli bacterium]|nr:DUF523 domain-containing protein [Acholeplasmataceae bacterium]MDY2902650.1 DUF523 domain-containing protein [Bacilli bacterium]
MKTKIGISSCLLGFKCKYNGLSNYIEEIEELKSKYELVPICPEVLGGLGVPRPPAEIKNDKVINANSIDVTENYQLGAIKALEILKENNVKIVILKSKSPSCGYKKIYDGSFTHSLKNGNGVSSNLFLKHGIKIYNENNFKDLL